MKHASLREPQAEPIYATAEMLTQKRGELDHLLKVEIPTNNKAIQTAREFGDLSENFEYKSARQRAGYLSARVGKLQGEMANVHVLDPTKVDTSVVRVGTKLLVTCPELDDEPTAQKARCRVRPIAEWSKRLGPLQRLQIEASGV